MGKGESNLNPIGMIWKNGIETCIISYMKRITSPSLMHDTCCSGLVHWDDPEGWYREGGSGWGICVYLWRIHVDVWNNQYKIKKERKKEHCK